MFLVAPCFAQANEDKAESAKIRDSSYRTVSFIDGWYYSSVIPMQDIARTGPGAGRDEIQPDGIGLMAAGQKADAAFKALNLQDHGEWFMYSATRRRYPAHGWVYEIAFTKKRANQPEYQGNQLIMTFLLDGTVIPVEIRKAG